MMISCASDALRFIKGSGVTVVGLDVKGNVLFSENVHSDLTEDCTNDLDMFANAINAGAKAIILCLSHPDTAIPSMKELIWGRSMVKASESCGPTLIDIIVGAPNGHFSFAGKGFMEAFRSEKGENHGC